MGVWLHNWTPLKDHHTTLLSTVILNIHKAPFQGTLQTSVNYLSPLASYFSLVQLLVDRLNWNGEGRPQREDQSREKDAGGSLLPVSLLPQHLFIGKNLPWPGKHQNTRKGKKMLLLNILLEFATKSQNVTNVKGERWSSVKVYCLPSWVGPIATLFKHSTKKGNQVNSEWLHFHKKSFHY